MNTPDGNPRVDSGSSTPDLLKALQREAWHVTPAKPGELPKDGVDQQHKGLVSMVPFSDIEVSLEAALQKNSGNKDDPSRTLDIVDWRVDQPTIETLKKVLPDGNLKVSLLEGLKLAVGASGDTGAMDKNEPDMAKLAHESVAVLKHIRETLQERRDIKARTTQELVNAKRGGEVLPGFSDSIARVLKPIMPDVTGKNVQNGLLAAGVVTTIWWTGRKFFGWFGGDKGEERSMIGSLAQLGVVAFTLSGLAEKAVNDGRSGFAMLGDSIIGAAHAADDVTLDLMRPENALEGLKRLGLNNSKYTQEISTTLGVGFPKFHTLWKDAHARTDKYHGQIRASELGVSRVPGLQDKELFELGQMLISGFPQLLLEKGELSQSEAAMVRNGEGPQLIEKWYKDKTVGQLYMDFLLGHRPRAREADVDNVLELDVSSQHINMLTSVRDHFAREVGGALTPVERHFSDTVTEIAQVKLIRDRKDPAKNGESVQISKAKLMELQSLLALMYQDYSHDLMRWNRQSGVVDGFRINALNGISRETHREMMSLKAYLDGHFALAKTIKLDTKNNPELQRGAPALTELMPSVNAIQEFTFDGSKKLKDFWSIKRYVRYLPGVDYAEHHDDLAKALRELGAPASGAATWEVQRKNLQLLSAVLLAMSAENITTPTEIKDKDGSVINATTNPAAWAQFQTFVALHATLSEFVRRALAGSTERRVQVESR